MYSALDGFSTTDEIAARIESLGLPGAFLTDHGTVAGFRPFEKSMRAKNLFCGFGMEAYQTYFDNRLQRPTGNSKRDQAHLILLAKNKQGYENLMRLSDEGGRTGYYYVPRVDWELLEMYKEGIICTSACMGGRVAKGIANDDLSSLHRYREIFRDDFYVEMHTYDSDERRALNLELEQICKDFSIPMLVANDAHYPEKDQYAIHEFMISMQYRNVYDKDKHLHPPSLYIMSEKEVRDALKYLKPSSINEAVKNTDEIMAKCEGLALPEFRQHLPKFKTENETSEQMLKRLLIKGLKEKYEITEEVIDRAEYEYDAISSAGLADYFLIVLDFINWSKKRGILVGPGRGSVGGSILAYALGITNIDPLKYGLYFERFWNPGRAKGLPDIDVDFEDTKRDEVKHYLDSLYGEESVIRIGNHTTFRPINSIIAVGKSMDVPYSDVRSIVKILDTTINAGQQQDWDVVYNMVGKDLQKWIDKYPLLFEMAELFTDRIKQYGIHASAFVLSDTDLRAELPCMMRTEETAKKEKVIATQLEMRGVEEAGYAKFDLLALRNLTTLAMTLKLAGVDENPNDVYWGLEPDEIEEGVGYWEQVDNGRGLGLFQIEDGGSAKSIGKELRPRSVLDLSAVVALNRPGPLRPAEGQKRSAKDKFLARRKGKEDVVFPHPILEGALTETHGEFIYQEQVITLARLMGYSAIEADHIRKILGKKLGKEMEAEKDVFLQMATKEMGAKTAKAVWKEIESFSKYGFNKSHSVGYGLLLAWTMWAKWRYPTEFIMALIFTASDLKRIGSIINEGRRIGVNIAGPHINKSEMGIDRVDGTIYYGLQNIKGVGIPASRWIIENRPFKTYDDLVSKRAAQQALWEAEFQGVRGIRPISPNMILKQNQIDALWNAGAFDTLEERDISDEDKAAFEEQLLGVVLTDQTAYVVENNEKEISQLHAISDLNTGEVDDIIAVVGVIKAVKQINSKRGNPMGFVTIEWEGEDTEVVVFPKIWDKYEYMMERNSVCRFDLKVQDGGSPIMEKGKRFV